MPTPTLLSIHVGLPQERETDGKPWRTGYFKAEVPGSIFVGHENLSGDGQALLGAHGGPDRAVLAYAAGHYPGWRAEFPDYAFPHGSFGENLVVSNLDEETVCIGDRHHLGPVVLEVAMPRSPCKNISRACGVEPLFARVQETLRIGWLYRVIVEGQIAPGTPITVERGPHPEWHVSRTFTVYRRVQQGDPTVLPEAATLAAASRLAGAWRERLARAGGTAP